MEKFTLSEDIPVFYITAASFPDGILESHQRMHSLIPFTTQRRYFGLSRPEQGQGIVYKAAAEILPGEETKIRCEQMIIPKGDYLNITVFNYMQKLEGITTAFAEILTQPGLDPDGYCVEWYLDEKNVRCMVKLA
jgi:hypothetical protein